MSPTKDSIRTLLLILSLLCANACSDRASTDDPNDGMSGTNPGTEDSEDAGTSEDTEDAEDSGDTEDVEGTEDSEDSEDTEDSGDTEDTAATCDSDGTDCGEGFTCDDSGDAIVCVDVDECEENTDACDEHASCANTEGSYECTCEDGFEGDGTECNDINECAEGIDDCDEESYCVNNEASFSCEKCPAGYEFNGDECAELAPHVLSSTPEQGANGVYPSEFFLDPTPGRGVRERAYIHLTFDMAMNTEETTIVVTDEGGLEEPRTIEGTWDETGHILTAIISPHDDGSTGALFDETTYNVNFADLESSFGTPVDTEDPSYPGAMLTFTTGFRDALINHACIHVQNGPFDSVTALATPAIWAPTVNVPHYHYTITMPEGSNAGYTLYFPAVTGFFRLYVRGADETQLEASILDLDTLEPGPWTPVELEVAPAACYTVGTDVGITHQFTLNLDEENIYMFRWTTPEDTVQMIVEYAGTEL